MSTPNSHPRPSQAASHPLQWPILDEVFHLAPFLTLNHHTISPIYYSVIHTPDLGSKHHPISHNHSIHPLASPHNSNHLKARDDLSQPLEGLEDESMDNDLFHHHDVSFQPSSPSLIVYILTCMYIGTRRCMPHHSLPTQRPRSLPLIRGGSSQSSYPRHPQDPCPTNHPPQYTSPSIQPNCSGEGTR